MVRPEFFVNILKEQGIDFYAGVPDSLLKNICAYITDHLPAEQNIIAANEGGAMGIAVGYHLATGKVPVVYMQNSGEGNIINPFATRTFITFLCSSLSVGEGALEFTMNLSM